MYQLIETSEVLDINTIVGVSFKELEKAEQKIYTAKYTEEFSVSEAMMNHIVNQPSDNSKGLTIREGNTIHHTEYFQLPDSVEKVTYKFTQK